MENKQLQHAKDTIAKKYGYANFEQFDDKSTFGYNHNTPKIIDEISIEYHRLMSEWVSVDERLPKMYQGVLVYFSNGFITIAYRKDTVTHYVWQLFGDDNLLNVNSEVKIKKWMPLPQPPK